MTLELKFPYRFDLRLDELLQQQLSRPQAQIHRLATNRAIASEPAVDVPLDGTSAEDVDSHYPLSLLFTENPALYQKSGFHVIPEVRFRAPSRTRRRTRIVRCSNWTAHNRQMPRYSPIASIGLLQPDGERELIPP